MKYFLIELKTQDDTILFYLNEADIYVKYDEETIYWSENCNIGESTYYKQFKITRVK